MLRVFVLVVAAMVSYAGTSEAGLFFRRSCAGGACGKASFKMKVTQRGYMTRSYVCGEYKCVVEMDEPKAVEVIREKTTIKCPSCN